MHLQSMYSSLVMLSDKQQSNRKRKENSCHCPLELCGIALYPGSSCFLQGEEPGYEAIRSVETWKSVDALHVLTTLRQSLEGNFV